MISKAKMANIKEYQCKHCNGVIRIKIMKDTEKATYPTIEFCPFCGMSNQYPKETEDDIITKKGNIRYAKRG